MSQFSVSLGRLFIVSLSFPVTAGFVLDISLVSIPILNFLFSLLSFFYGVFKLSLLRVCHRELASLCCSAVDEVGQFHREYRSICLKIGGVL
jgi:hypothetical protein